MSNFSQGQGNQGIPRSAAQVFPQIDAEIAGNGHFWMETSVRPNGKIWFPARPERVFNRRHSALCRGLKTSENAAGDRKVPFMDGH